MINWYTIWIALATLGLLLLAGMGFPIPEELPIVGAGALCGHAARPPAPEYRAIEELKHAKDDAEKQQIAARFTPRFVAALAAAPTAPFPASVPWAPLAHAENDTVIPHQEPVLWWVLLPTCILGVVLSDGILYCIGRFGGIRILKLPWVRKLLPPERLERIEGNFHRYGVLILMFARFLPGIRAPIFLTAGIMRLPWRKFLFADGIYAIPGVSLLFFLSYWFTDTFEGWILGVESKLKSIVIVGSILAVALYFLYRFLRRPVSTGDPKEEIPLIGKQVAAGMEHSRIMHPPQKPRRVLVVCGDNASRSLLAEALWRKEGGDRYVVSSAGAHPQPASPYVARVLEEIGVPACGLQSKSFHDLNGQQFDLIVTLCDSPAEKIDHLPGHGQREHWFFDDPGKAHGTEEERLASFRRVRDQIAQRVREYLKPSERG